jgi:hypothetical protein
MLNPRLVSRLRKTDWDFAGKFSESPFSAIHWYPGRFVSQLPATFIGLLAPEDGTVLDPFVGSGTTLVEAQRLGRRGIGIDLHPIACLVSRAKTLRISAQRIATVLASIASDAEDVILGQLRTHRGLPPRAAIPSTVQATKWYAPRVQDHLARLWSLVMSYDKHRRVLGMTAFSAILLPVCRETRHWGYVCDNTEPDGDTQADVLKEFVDVLGSFGRAYADRDKEIVARKTKFVTPPKSTVVCRNSLDAILALPPNSVDLVLTSPPYFGVSDYTKSQRLSMEWFGLDIEAIRLQEIGARSKRHRARAAEDYVSELKSVFSALHGRLRRQGSFVMIVGESAARGSVIGHLLRAAQESGFMLHLDVSRIVSSQRNQTPSIRGEHLLVFSR